MFQLVYRTFLPARRVRRPFCYLLLAGALTSCGGGEPEAPPVATPSLTLDRERVAIGSPVRLTYRFQVAPDAKIDGDYTVFVHALTPDGEQMWTDDHKPPVPTSQWQPGQTIEYGRTVFVPNYPYVGEATMRLGLYEQERRLPLAGTDAGRREYTVADFQVLPQSENIFLVDKEGWHPAEIAPDDPASEWRWTGKRAVLSFRNPRKDATFYLEYDARTDQFESPQTVTIRSGDQVIGSFTADARDKKLLTFPIKAEQFGEDDLAELTIEVDKTFKPGGGDPRELGVRVYHTFVEPAQ